MKREIRFLYKLLLKPDGKVLDVRKVIEMYHKYDEFRNEVLNSEEAPETMKGFFPKVEMPKYLEWVQQYVIKEEYE
jgi:hypothetical protein